MQTPPLILRVAIYIRVSTKLQEDRYSLSGQLTELTRYAKAQGWEIVDTFKDVESGAKFDKQGLEALLDCVEDGKVDIVLVIEQDRLSRLDTVDWELLKDVLRENGVKIAEPGSMIDLSNDDDEFISDIKNLLARRERRSIKRKMNRGIRQYTREGKLYGRQPDEYIFDSKTKTVTENNDRSWVITFIDRLYLEEGYGMHRIAEELNKISRTANGKKWTAVQVQFRLTNKAYHGVLERTFENGETISVENVYPTLRTKETYEKITLKMQTKDFRIPSVSYNHALRRLKMVCSHCGRTLSLIKGQVQNDRHFNVYVAHAREYAEPCEVNPSYNAQLITRPLFQAIKDILLDKDLAKQYVDFEFEEKDKMQQMEREIEAIERQLITNNEKIDKLLDLYLDGSWSKEKLDENKHRIEQDSSLLSEHLENLNRKVELVKSNQYNYESFIKTMNVAEEFLAIIDRAEVEMDELDQEKLVSDIFENAELNAQTNTFRLTAKSIQNVPVLVEIKIDDINIIAEQKLREKQYERFLATQAVLNLYKDTPLSFMDLKRLTGLNAQTLRKDEELFGHYLNLKLGKGSVEKKEQALEIIKKCLTEDIKMRSVDIAKRAGVNAGTVLKYIREYELRPTKK